MVKRGPRKSQDFWGRGAATKRLPVFRKAKHRKSGVCRDEASKAWRRGQKFQGVMPTKFLVTARGREAWGWVAERVAYALRRFFRLRSRFRLDMTARRCDLSCENLCGAAGAAVRSSAPSSVSMASWETHFARRCLASPLDGGGICGSK